MNKIIAILISMLIFSHFSYAQSIYTESLQSDDEEINKIISEFDHIKKKKDEIIILERLARKLSDIGQYTAAENVYIMLLNQKVSKKQKFSYYEYLGDIYALQKNYSMSLDTYRKAESLYKKNTGIKIKIGDILLKSNLYNLAEDNYLSVLSIDKGSDIAKRKLGDIYFKQEIYTAALKYYSDISHLSFDKDLIINMAISYRAINKIDESISILEEFIIENQDPEVYFMLGILYVDKRMNDKAEKMFLRSLELEVGNIAVYIHLSSLYIFEGDLDKAKEFLDKAYRLDSSYAIIDIMYSVISYRKGRFYEARRYAYNASLKAKTSFVKEQARRLEKFLNRN